MKIDRLLGIIIILLKKDKVTAPFLAERFEVSRRTINRDIEDLCKAGIPIISTQGYDGGITIEDGYKIDKTIFKLDELQAIFAGLSGIDSISSNIHTNNIYDKFSSDKNSVIANSGNVLIDLSSHYKKSLTEKIELIKVAINEQNLISFRYFYNKGEANKTIEPYLIVFKWSSWYVFGYCLERNDFRLYKLNRLWDLKCNEKYFNQRVVPSEAIEFNDYFSSGIKLTALFNSKVKYRLIEEYGIDSFTILEDGKLKFNVGFESYENLLSWVLSFGDLIEVIEPKEVRLELKRQAEKIFNRY